MQNFRNEGKRLKEFRDSYGISLERMSEKTGIAKSTLIGIESGKIKNPHSVTIFKLKKYVKEVESVIVDY